ncbi:hypothetical protein GCM10009853_023420 [Glycomyces scopariae]
MAGQYAAKVEGLVERYGDRVRPPYAQGVRSAFTVGEWGLAAAELASALLADGIPVAADDKALFRELLGKIELSPDTPKDLAEQLRVEEPFEL